MQYIKEVLITLSLLVAPISLGFAVQVGASSCPTGPNGAASCVGQTNSSSSATFQSDACGGLGALNSSAAGCDSSADSHINGILSTVISILSYVVGIVAVIMIIYGGIKMVLSQGDSSSFGTGRNTVIYALIGVVVAVLAQVLVHFVLFKTSGAPACVDNPSVAAGTPECPQTSQKQGVPSATKP